MNAKMRSFAFGVLLLASSVRSFQHGWNLENQRQALLDRSFSAIAAKTGYLSKPPSFLVVLAASTVLGDKSDKDDEDEREFARVRRRGNRKWDSAEEDDYYGDPSEKNQQKGGYYDDQKANDWQDDYYDDDDEEYYDDEDDSDWEREKNDIFSNVLIPNPILDSMDPDGAAERFPELARDPKFWIEMLLFVAFLDFVSYAGPRNPFPDLPI